MARGECRIKGPAGFGWIQRNLAGLELKNMVVLSGETPCYNSVKMNKDD